MEGLGIFAGYAAFLIVVMLVPALRARVTRWAAEIWQGFLVACEVPLRAITGRQRPDYRRIAALEAELAGVKPKSRRAALADYDSAGLIRRWTAGESRHALAREFAVDQRAIRHMLLGPVPEGPGCRAIDD